MRERDIYFLFTCEYLVSPEPFVDWVVLSPMYIFALFVKHHIDFSHIGFYLCLSPITLVYVSVLMAVPCCPCYCGSVVFETTYVEAFSVAPFTFRMALCFGCLSSFCKNLGVIFSISVKNITRILMWDLMNLYVTFGNIAILILLIYADP